MKFRISPPEQTQFYDDCFNILQKFSVNTERNHEGPNQEGTRICRVSGTFATRIIIHGYHPHDKPNEGGIDGKLIHLPESVEGLLTIAEKKFGKTGSIILLADGSQQKDLGALQENDRLYIV